MMRHARRMTLGLSVLVSGIAAVILSPAAAAQTSTNYPSKPVKLVVGFAPGTGPDYVGRLLAQKLSELWGDRATAFVENKSGAGGNLAPADVSRANPDGYTLLLSGINSLVIAPAVSSKLPFNPQKDFVHITQVGVSAFAFLTNPKTVPATNVREFVAWARKQPKGIFMGTFGAGTTGHFASIIFTSAVDIKTEVIHYRTTSDVIGALVNGDIAGVISSLTVAVPHVKSGTFAAIAVTGTERNKGLPNVPTIKEQGVPIEVNAWFGIAAPALTPTAIVAKLNSDLRTVLHSPDVRSKLEAVGISATGPTTQEFAQILQAELKTWGSAIAASGFKSD